MLEAGYLEDWEYHATLSGSPQGGVVSPILSSIYLSKLDNYVETVLIPQYSRGNRREHNPEYERTRNQMTAARRRGDRNTARELRHELRQIPSGDPQDPGYRRLRYSRYADLCRHRHKSAYADLWIMPTGLLEGLPGGQVVAL